VLFKEIFIRDFICIIVNLCLIFFLLISILSVIIFNSILNT
jgi:hypothetical protein